jgi:TolB-like protein
MPPTSPLSPAGRASCLLIASLLVATAAPRAAAAQGAGVTLAIAYFDDDTAVPAYAPLRKGLADMMITDLASMPALHIVEREKLNQVLAELKLGRSKFVDPRTAQKLGKGLAAAYIVTGSYILSGATLRLDCRVIEVTTGRVIASQKVEGPKDDFFALEKDLVHLLLKTLDIKLAADDDRRLRRNQTQSFEAWTRYSAGLDAHDAGDDDRARALFQAALEADPNYASARSATERLKVIFDREDRQKALAANRLFVSLDPKAPDFGQKVNDLLAGYDNTDVQQLRNKIALLRWLAERDLTPSTGGYARAASEVLSLVSRYLQTPSQAAVIPAVCEYVITRFPKDAMAPKQCKVYLKVLEGQAHGAPRPFPSWQERRRHATVDWEIALLENEAETFQLFALYARKVRR